MRAAPGMSFNGPRDSHMGANPYVAGVSQDADGCLVKKDTQLLHSGFFAFWRVLISLRAE
jgi:hypothetical protein